MRLIFIILGFLTIGTNLIFAQHSNRDSLFQVWNNDELADTTRMEALLFVINGHYMGKNLDSARLLTQVLNEFTIEKAQKRYMGKAKHTLGDVERRFGDLKLAETHFRVALEIFESIQDYAGMAKTYNSLASISTRNGNSDLAAEQLNKSIEMDLASGDTAATSAAIINTARIFEAQGKTLKSLEWNNKALEISIRYGKRLHEGISRNNIGNNYKDLGDIPKASKKYQECLAIYEEVEDNWGISSALNNLAVLYMDEKDFDRAMDYLQRNLKLSEETNMARGKALSYINIGSVHTLQENFSKGLEAYEQGLTIATDHNILDMVPAFQLEIGQVHLLLDELDLAEQFLNEGLANSLTHGRNFEVMTSYLYLSKLQLQKGNLVSAQNYAEKGLERAQNAQHLASTSDFVEQLVKIHKGLGDSGKALEMFELRIKLRDSLYNLENTRTIINQEYQYSYEKKAYQDSLKNASTLAIQEAEINRRRAINSFLWGGIILTLIFGGVLYNRYRFIAQQRQMIQVEKNKSEEANTKLREIDASKTRFFTNISHEFRTPLTVIKGMTEQIKDNERAKTLINRNTNHLLALINQILDLRKLESGNLQVQLIQTDVVKYLKYVLESFQSLSEDKKIQLNFLSEEEQLVLDIDQDKLLRIVSNLLSNALKFTPSEGQIDLHLTTSPQATKPYYQFEVIDTGVGIPKDRLPYIFDRFYQVDDIENTGEGSGIGLTLIKELVELMDGQIAVESEVGKGTTFKVQLPITNDAPVDMEVGIAAKSIAGATMDRSAIRSLEPSLSSADLPTLLIVEDNPDVTEYLITCLEDQYRLSFAADGQEGIEKALVEVPDIIISDVMMPRANGFTLCNTLKTDERTSHIPIILLTAKADEESRIAGLSRGADAYLAKPFDQKELEVRLQSLIILRKRLQERYSKMGQLAPTEEVVFQQEDAFIKRIRTIVEENLADENFNVPELCKKAALSRTQMHHKIKSLTGKSTSHFIRAIRVQKASELLHTTDLNISEIAMEVGMKSLSYFSRIFATETGLSPNKFREKGKLRQQP